MKASSSIALALLVAGAAAWVTYAMMSSRQRATMEQRDLRRRPTAGPLIVASHPASRTFEQRVPWIGTVQSRSAVHLRALVDGRVEAIQADDQAAVRSGQSILRLGGPHVESRRARMRATIDTLKSRLALAEQTAQRLSKDVADQLATKDQLAAAQQARLALSGQLQDARITLESLEHQLVVTAPAAGVFTNRQVSLGQTVRAGQTLGDVVDPGRLRVLASLFPPEGSVVNGKEASIRLAQDRSVIGTITQVLPEMSKTGAVQVWIEGPQIDGQLAAGQTVSGTITIRTAPSAVAVPASAIVFDSKEQPYVFVKTDDTYVRRRVALGLWQDGWVQVLSGVKQSETIATHGAYELYYRRFSSQFKVED